MQAGWEHFTHQADIGIRGVGATRAQAFEQAGFALTAVVSDPASIRPEQEVDIQCEAPDDEFLFADWLNALIYEMAVRHMLFSRFQVQMHDHRLSAQVWGEPISRERHQPCVEIKGATYTSLLVTPFNGGWMAQTVLDV